MDIKYDKDKALVLYRSLIDSLQGKTFFVQDEEGVLRRWVPPKSPIFDKNKDL